MIRGKGQLTFADFRGCRKCWSARRDQRGCGKPRRSQLQPWNHPQGQLH